MRGSKDPKPTVVITGSDGLIGSALVRALHEKYDLVGFDNDRTAELDHLYDLICCDLTDPAGVSDAFRRLRERHGNRIAAFIHLAAYYDFSGEDSPLYQDLTIEGTRRVLEELQAFDVEQFIFSSTLLVMKPSQDGEPIDESSPTQAEWQYPESKLEAEKLIQRLRGDMKAVLLRIAGVYDEWGRAVPIVQQMKRIHEKELESYVFPGNDEHGQSMVHLDDLVDCIEKAIENRGELAGVETFLVGEPAVMSYEELQEQIGELLHGEEWPSIRIPKPVAKLGAKAKQALGGKEETFIQPWMVDLADQDYRIRIDKARNLLGWEPRHRLRDVLPTIAGRLLDDGAEWRRKNHLPEQPEPANA